MEGCFEHGISHQLSFNRPPFGLSRILREELFDFYCEQYHPHFRLRSLKAEAGFRTPRRLRHAHYLKNPADPVHPV